MTWILIDGNNWYARDFFASPADAATHFKRRLHDLRNQVEHSRIAITWDARSSFRHELSSVYKSGRAEKPEGFHRQLAELRNDLATVEGVTTFHVEGFEADDLLATLAHNAIDEGEKSVIFSGDKDLHQCLSKGLVTQIVSVRRDKPGRLSFVAMTADKLVIDYKVNPWQWVDFQVMVGGNDSLKGCDGIGPKTAAAILQACESLDGFYKEPFKAPITPKLRGNLLAFKSQAESLRRLVTLVDSAPLPATWLDGVAL
jgi:DNA polymerase I